MKASYCRYGPPNLKSLSRREQEAGARMRLRLLSGEDKSLTVESKVRRQIFPPEVVSSARRHWEEITVIDPALHRRSGPSSATIQV